MNKLKLLFLFQLVIFFSQNLFAKKKHSPKNHENMSHSLNDKDHDHSDQKATLKKVGQNQLIVKVKGMVCAFCAQGIKENFNKRKEVKQTKVDLDSMEVSVELRPGKTLFEKTIKKIVTDAGFSYEGRKK